MKAGGNLWFPAVNEAARRRNFGPKTQTQGVYVKSPLSSALGGCAGTLICTVASVPLL